MLSAIRVDDVVLSNTAVKLFIEFLQCPCGVEIRRLYLNILL